jgi:ABC-type lipoprotein export system ATPase subunit
MDLLVAAVKEQSKTVVLVTHNLEYLPLGDKLFYIKDGLLNDNVTASQIVNNLGPLLTKEAKS